MLPAKPRVHRRRSSPASPSPCIASYSASGGLYAQHQAQRVRRSDHALPSRNRTMRSTGRNPSQRLAVDRDQFVARCERMRPGSSSGRWQSPTDTTLQGHDRPDLTARGPNRQDLWRQSQRFRRFRATAPLAPQRVSTSFARADAASCTRLCALLCLRHGCGAAIGTGVFAFTESLRGRRTGGRRLLG